MRFNRIYLCFVLIVVMIGAVPATMLAQSLNSVNPDHGYQNTQLTVTISGQNTSFGQGTATTQVWFEQGTNTLMYPSSVAVIDANTVAADIYLSPFYQTGTYDVKVLNSIDGQLTLANSFTLFPFQNMAEIINVTPQTGETSSVINVTISGQNTSFGQGTSTTNVWLDKGAGTVIYPTNLNVVDNTTLNVELTLPHDQAIGMYTVKVNNSINGLLSYIGFDVQTNMDPPQVLSISPNESYRGEVLTVDISGYKTHFGQGTATTQVWLEEPGSFLFADNLNMLNLTDLNADLNIGITQDTGYYDLRVENYIDGSMTLPSAFRVLTDTTHIIEQYAKHLAVYPNPCRDLVNIQFNTNSGGYLQLFNGQGDVVRQMKQTSRNARLGLANLPAGVYVYRMIEGASISTGKLIIE